MGNSKWNKILHPNDKLVTTILSDTQEAASLIQGNLPASAELPIDWDSLRLLEGSYVDEEFQATETDLLFEANLVGLKTSVMVFVLFEHQSRSDKWMRLRLLEYVTQIWKKSFNDQPKQSKLSPIVSIVFYQGKHPWTHSTEFLDLVEHEGMNTSYLPQFKHYLIDQSQYGLGQFKGKTKGKIVQLLLKMVYHGHDIKELRQLAQWLGHVEDSPGLDVVDFFITFFLDSVDVSSQKLYEIIIEETHSQTLGDKAMTAGDRLREEGAEIGEKRGREDGIKIGEKRGEKRGLDKGVLIGAIQYAQKTQKLPQSSIESLFAKTPKALQKILDQLEEN